MIVKSAQRGRADLVMGKQFSRPARILGEDQAGGGQNIERAQSDVAQIADRRRDNIKSGGQLA